jgi:hypothetical protein
VIEVAVIDALRSLGWSKIRFLEREEGTEGQGKEGGRQREVGS